MMIRSLFLGLGGAILFLGLTLRTWDVFLILAIISSLGVDSVLEHHCFVDESLLYHQPIIYICVAT